MNRKSYIVLLVVLVGSLGAKGSGCCNVPPPVPPKFLLTGPTSLVYACGNNEHYRCLQEGTKLACVDEQRAKCGSDGYCQFPLDMITSPATCPCYESEVRWCPNSSGNVQYCKRTEFNTTNVTMWHVDANGDPVCGPTKVDCPPGIDACSKGLRETRYSLGEWVEDEMRYNLGEWVEDKTLKCEPNPPCPPENTIQECNTERRDANGGCSKIYMSGRW